MTREDVAEAFRAAVELVNGQDIPVEQRAAFILPLTQTFITMKEQAAAAGPQIVPATAAQAASVTQFPGSSS